MMGCLVPRSISLLLVLLFSWTHAVVAKSDVVLDTSAIDKCLGASDNSSSATATSSFTSAYGDTNGSLPFSWTVVVQFNDSSESPTLERDFYLGFNNDSNTAPYSACALFFHVANGDEKKDIREDPGDLEMPAACARDLINEVTGVPDTNDINSWCLELGLAIQANPPASCAGYPIPYVEGEGFNNFWLASPSWGQARNCHLSTGEDYSLSSISSNPVFVNQWGPLQSILTGATPVITVFFPYDVLTTNVSRGEVHFASLRPEWTEAQLAEISLAASLSAPRVLGLGLLTAILLMVHLFP